jgi:hypothetical protein
MLARIRHSDRGIGGIYKFGILQQVSSRERGSSRVAHLKDPRTWDPRNSESRHHAYRWNFFFFFFLIENELFICLIDDL